MSAYAGPFVSHVVKQTVKFMLTERKIDTNVENVEIQLIHFENGKVLIGSRRMISMHQFVESSIKGLPASENAVIEKVFCIQQKQLMRIRSSLVENVDQSSSMQLTIAKFLATLESLANVYFPKLNLKMEREIFENFLLCFETFARSAKLKYQRRFQKTKWHSKIADLTISSSNDAVVFLDFESDETSQYKLPFAGHVKDFIAYNICTEILNGKEAFRNVFVVSNRQQTLFDILVDNSILNSKIKGTIISQMFTSMTAGQSLHLFTNRFHEELAISGDERSNRKILQIQYKDPNTTDIFNVLVYCLFHGENGVAFYLSDKEMQYWERLYYLDAKDSVHTMARRFNVNKVRHIFLEISEPFDTTSQLRLSRATYPCMFFLNTSPEPIITDLVAYEQMLLPEARSQYRNRLDYEVLDIKWKDSIEDLAKLYLTSNQIEELLDLVNSQSHAAIEVDSKRGQHSNNKYSVDEECVTMNDHLCKVRRGLMTQIFEDGGMIDSDDDNHEMEFAQKRIKLTSDHKPLRYVSDSASAMEFNIREEKRKSHIKTMSLNVHDNPKDSTTDIIFIDAHKANEFGSDSTFLCVPSQLQNQ